MMHNVNTNINMYLGKLFTDFSGLFSFLRFMFQIDVKKKKDSVYFSPLISITVKLIVLRQFYLFISSN